MIHNTTDRVLSLLSITISLGLCRRLRKASRELVDQVKQYHFMFTSDDFTRFQLWKRFKPSRFARQPGIYLLRDATSSRSSSAALSTSATALKRTPTAVRRRPVVAHRDPDRRRSAEGEYLAAFKEDLVRRYAPQWNVNLVGLNQA